MKELIRQSSKNDSIYHLSSQIEESRSGSKLVRRRTSSIIDSPLRMERSEKDKGRIKAEEPGKFMPSKPTVE